MKLPQFFVNINKRHQSKLTNYKKILFFLYFKLCIIIQIQFLYRYKVIFYYYQNLYFPDGKNNMKLKNYLLVIW